MEIYTYLGKQNSTFFFLHTISEKKFKKEFTYQILNCLIHEGFVNDVDMNCIIFEIDPFNVTTDAIIINHQLGKNYEYYKDNLESQLKRLVNLDREKIDVLVIAYDYKIGGFLTYEFPFVIPKFGNTDIHLNQIEYIQTTKPIE